MAAKATMEASRADLEAARALARRGGPFNPLEYAQLEQLDPAERSAMRYRTVGPQRSAEDLEDTRRIEEKFGAKRGAAESELAAALAAREGATEAMFVARDALRAVESATFITGGWGGGTYNERGGTPEQIEAAKGRLEEAEQAWREAREREGHARVRLTAVGVARDAFARALSEVRIGTT